MKTLSTLLSVIIVFFAAESFARGTVNLNARKDSEGKIEFSRTHIITSNDVKNGGALLESFSLKTILDTISYVADLRTFLDELTNASLNENSRTVILTGTRDEVDPLIRLLMRLMIPQERAPGLWAFKKAGEDTVRDSVLLERRINAATDTY